MAVAGLHNVSVLDSSFHRESQPPISRRWANQDRPSNGPSSLLRMWRDLEGEHLVTHPRPRLEERSPQHGTDVSNIEFVSTYLSEGEGLNEIENECGTTPQGQMGPQNEHEDNSSYSSELSNDFGEIERERVRQIFREWTNSGLRGHETGSRMSNCSRSQLLGENERERVRVVREWVEMTTQQRGTSRGSIEEQQDAEIGSQIARVRDGLIVNHREIGCQRTIRRLCGRQALIDLLARAERERKRELQCLLENRPVSDFSHRNRIQSLLRGRFLQNKRFVYDERSTTSLAASELGLLRQRHTVSGLREGFLTRVDNFAPSPLGSDQSDTSSIDDVNSQRNGQNHGNTFEAGPDEMTDPSQSTNDESEANISTTDNFENTGRSINPQESIAHIEERQEQEQVSFVETVVNEWSQEPLGTEGNAQGTIQEASEVLHNHDDEAEADSEERLVQGQIYHLEASIVEDFDWEDVSAQEEEWQESGEWRENTEEMDSQENSHQWYQETRGNDNIGQNDLQELHQEWHENVVADVESVAVNERVDTFYFPEDDNQSNLELRELLSRRRVSNLLQSGFRESLDQLVQSYVQRQSHASLEWEQEMEGGDQNPDELDSIERAPLDLPPSPLTTLPHWDQDSHDDATWQRSNTHQRSVIEWEIINELRMDMARLQQRMNNMQRLLEACMEMQLELQRSVRQEVSAALNRSSDSSEACGDSALEDESKWDHVRKGICCLCCDSNINSLLYRCGHMCTCSKCADNLVQGRGKCPMCRAPVVEVIRAYSIM